MNSSSTLSVFNGTFAVAGRIDIDGPDGAFGGDLHASGLTASVTAGSASASLWTIPGAGVGGVNVSFSDNATGSFNGGINVATSGKADILIQTGADSTVGNSALGDSAFNVLHANLTVAGAGSTFNVNPGRTLTVGSSNSSGHADVNLQNGGVLTVGAGGTTNVKLSGTINLDGGTLNTPTITLDGTLNFNGGTLGITGPNGFTIGNDQPLGSTVSLTAGKTLSVTNTTSVNGGALLTLDGGTLVTNSLANNGAFVFNAGILSITGASGFNVSPGGLLGSNVTLGANKTINVTAALGVNAGSLLSVESGGRVTAASFSNFETISLDGASAVDSPTESESPVSVVT